MLIVSFVLLWLVVLFNLLLTLALIRRINALPQGGQLVQGGLKSGEIAPSFTAQNLEEGPVAMAEYAGHPVLFVFVAPGCTPCHTLLPHLNEIYPGAQQAGVKMVCVSGGDLESTRQMTQEMDISLPIVVAPQASNAFYRDYKIQGTPTYCFINAHGVVVSSGYPGQQNRDWQTLTSAWNKPKKSHAL